MDHLCATRMLLCFGAFLLAWQVSSSRANEVPRPAFAEIKECVEAYFRKDRDRRREDIVTRSQAADVVKLLKQIGWEVPDERELLDSLLDDQHVMVRTFRTPAGRRFLAKIADRDLIYDRFDRLSDVSGGSQLIRDIVKLPDGEKYAKPHSGGGVPDLLDLLPKNASGTTRRVANYDKPTGHIYTLADLLAWLAGRYQTESERNKSVD